MKKFSAFVGGSRGRGLAVVVVGVLFLGFSVSGVASLLQTNWFNGFLGYQAPVPVNVSVGTVGQALQNVPNGGSLRLSPNEFSLPATAEGSVSEVAEFASVENSLNFSSVTVSLPENAQGWEKVFSPVCTDFGGQGCVPYEDELYAGLNIKFSVGDGSGWGELVSGSLREFMDGDAVVAKSAFGIPVSDSNNPANCDNGVAGQGCVKLEFGWESLPEFGEGDEFALKVSMDLPFEVVGVLQDSRSGSVLPFAASLKQDFVYSVETVADAEVLFALEKTPGGGVVLGDFVPADSNNAVDIFGEKIDLGGLEDEGHVQRVFFAADNVDESSVSAVLQVNQLGVQQMLSAGGSGVLFDKLRENLRLKVDTSAGVVVDNTVANILQDEFGTNGADREVNLVSPDTGSAGLGWVEFTVSWEPGKNPVFTDQEFDLLPNNFVTVRTTAAGEGHGVVGLQAEVEVDKPVVTFVDIQNVDAASFALDDENRLWVWGTDTSGLFGAANNVGDVRVPNLFTTFVESPSGNEDLLTALKDPVVGVKSFGISNNHGLLVTNNDQVFSWGANDRGQLGTGTTGGLQRGVFNNITERFENNVVISKVVARGGATTGFSLFLSDDGKVWGAGSNGNGRLGLGQSASANVPTRVVQNIGGVNIVNVVAGGSHSLFLSDDGQVWSTGASGTGELGLDATGDVFVPTRVVQNIGSENIVDVSAGGSGSLFLSDDGKVWGTGSNGNGRLGLGQDITFVTVPTRVVQNIGSENIVNVAFGVFNSLFLDDNGQVWGVGVNSNGQLGIGNTLTNVFVPTRPAGLNEVNVKKIFVSSSRMSFFVDDTGQTWGAGSNGDHRLGVGGGTGNRTRPEKLWHTPKNVISSNNSVGNNESGFVGDTENGADNSEPDSVESDNVANDVVEPNDSNEDRNVDVNNVDKDSVDTDDVTVELDDNNDLVLRFFNKNKNEDDNNTGTQDNEIVLPKKVGQKNGLHTNIVGNNLFDMLNKNQKSSLTINETHVQQALKNLLKNQSNHTDNSDNTENTENTENRENIVKQLQKNQKTGETQKPNNKSDTEETNNKPDTDKTGNTTGTDNIANIDGLGGVDPGVLKVLDKLFLKITTTNSDNETTTFVDKNLTDLISNPNKLNNVTLTPQNTTTPTLQTVFYWKDETVLNTGFTLKNFTLKTPTTNNPNSSTITNSSTVLPVNFFAREPNPFAQNQTF